MILFDEGANFSKIWLADLFFLNALLRSLGSIESCISLITLPFILNSSPIPLLPVTSSNFNKYLNKIKLKNKPMSKNYV